MSMHDTIIIFILYLESIIKLIKTNYDQNYKFYKYITFIVYYNI